MSDPYVVERKILRRPGYPESPNGPYPVIFTFPMTQAMQPDDVLIVASIRRNDLYRIQTEAFGAVVPIVSLNGVVEVAVTTGQTGVPTIIQKIYDIYIDAALYGVALIVRGLNVPYVGGLATAVQNNLAYPTVGLTTGVPTPNLAHSPGTFALYAANDQHADSNGFTVMTPSTDWVSQLSLTENIGAGRRLVVQTHIGLVPEMVNGAYKNLTASPQSVNGTMVMLGQGVIPVDFVGWGTPI